MLDQDLFHELMFYTLAHPDPAFLHQHAVDAYAAQHATDASKPIATVFALVGLYLHVERSFTGKQVQQVHMKLAARRRVWLAPPLPTYRGHMVIAEVVAASPGPARDGLVHQWCVSVWTAFSPTARAPIATLLQQELDIA